MRRFLGYLFTLLILVACNRQEPAPVSTPSPAATGTAIEIVAPTATAVVTAGPTQSPIPLPNSEDSSTSGVHANTLPSEEPSWPSPMTAVAPLARLKPTAAQQATLIELQQATPPERDDVRLAIAYRGLTETPVLTASPVTEPLAVGSVESFKVSNTDTNTVSVIDATLLAVGEHAYFWFDTGPGSISPDQEALDRMALAFDRMYETDTFYFGSESNPGIDGDSRVHILNASPLALCDVTEETASSCGLAGYFSPSNVLPAAVEANSNAREMFFMNGRYFGSDFYLNVLGHEFRHMIEDNYDRGDADWAVEGSATLAEELVGFPHNAWSRANQFLANPDQQLNSWTDSGTTPYYGQGYLFNRYLYDRLGTDLYREFATSPDSGLLALDSVAKANGHDWTGESLWLDWLVALAIHDEPGAAEIYRFDEGNFDTAAMKTIDTFPATEETTVAQYAADYYELSSATSLTVTFTGSTLVPLLDTVPASGQRLWYAQRTNYGNPRLTRPVDLRGVEEATLQYAVYADIERGYDFAYVAVSEDNGRTWQGLTAGNMQGLDPEDNPAHTALSERFYTGRTRAWKQESIDLTPYTGQQIQLRFEYVTDPVLTYGGLALDNIAIPEVGFYDDAETAVDGWVAEGFTRATAYLPQPWHLQVVTFAGGQPFVETLPLASDQTITFLVDEENAGRTILIVAATAPLTLQPAHYKLAFSN